MPEETDEYIRILVNNCKITSTITISEKEGIKALYCNKVKQIATYLFDKRKGWDMEKAKKWVKEHRKSNSDCKVHTTVLRQNHISLSGTIIIPDEVKVKQDGRRIIAGYASIVEIDLADDLITHEALQYGLQALIEDERYANIMLSHTDIQIGHLLKEYNGLVTHVDEKGLFIVAELRKGFSYVDTIWNDILEGKLNGFSIAGFVEEGGEERVCDGDKCWNQINKITLFEVSICEFPCNIKSGFIILNKHKINVNENVDNIEKGETMPKKKKETTEELKEEEIEQEVNPLEELCKGFESLSQEVSGIVRRMEALEKIVQDTFEPKEEEKSEEVEQSEEIENKEIEEPSTDEEVKSNDEAVEQEPKQSEEIEEDCKDCHATKEEQPVEESVEKSIEEPEQEKSDEVVETPVEETEPVVESDTEEPSDEIDELGMMKKSIDDRDNLIKEMEKKISDLETKLSNLEQEEKPKSKVVKDEDFGKCDENKIVVKNGEVYIQD